MRIFHAPMLFAILFSFITISVSAEISERWEEPPLQKIRELFPLRKQTCGNVVVTTIKNKEGKQLFDLRIIAMPKQPNLLNILMYKQEGKDIRVAYYINSDASLPYFQKQIDPSIFEKEMFLISFEYAHYLLEEFGDQHDRALLGKKWCVDEVLE